jgi:hypothetical protein
MNIEQTARLVRAYIKRDTPAFLWGGPGIGKSAVVRQVADEMGVNMIDFRAVLRDPVDLRGLPAIQGDTAKWLAPDDLPQAARDGEEGIFFMDELNAAPPSMQAACFGLVLDRKVGDYHLPKGWRIIAAGNRQSDKAAAQRMPSALANRFAHVDVEADSDDFTKWANKNGLAPELIAFIRFRPALLHDMKAADLRAFPSPRAWVQAAKYVEERKEDRLPLVTGLVGEGAAAEFEGFLRTYQSLPTIEQVLAHPDTAKLPGEGDIAARYAIVSALATKSTTQNFDQVMRYTARLPREFAVMLVVDACRRDSALTRTKSFVQWAKDNQDVLL